MSSQTRGTHGSGPLAASIPSSHCPNEETKADGANENSEKKQQLNANFSPKVFEDVSSLSLTADNDEEWDSSEEEESEEWDSLEEDERVSSEPNSV